MTLADAMAALVGIPWGRHHIRVLKGTKSIEGSVAFFLTSIVIWLFFYKDLNYSALFVPLVLTVIELLLSLGLDNLILPIVAAYLFTLF